MDDQLFGDALSLESLIEQGLVTHLCSRDASAIPDETAVLTALGAAIAGQIYRIDSLTYVFRIEETDLDGALAGAPFQKWATLVAANLRTALDCASTSHALYVRALVKGQPAATPKPKAMEPEIVSIMIETADAEAMAESIDDEIEVEAAVFELDEPEAQEMVPEPSPAALDPRIDELAAAVARLEDAMSVASSDTQERATALDQRLSSLDTTLATLCAEIASQNEVARSTRRLLDDLANESRKLPERAARHFAARADSFGPIMLSLTSVLQRLEDRLEQAPDNTPLQDSMAALQDQIASVAAGLTSAPQAPEQSDTRLDALEEELRRVPERTATHVSARTTSLIPLHVALSSALNRLEGQVGMLLKRDDPSATEEIAPDLRVQMAEFLSRMEQRFADVATPSASALAFPIMKPSNKNSQ